MKILLWLYALTGTTYYAMYLGGNEVVDRFAFGPLWLLMVLAPVILGGLVLWPVLRNFFSAGQR